MVLVLFFIILIVLLILLTSAISFKIDIKNFRLYKEGKENKKTNKDYEVIVYAYIFKNIKIYNYKLKNLKISKEYFSKINKKIDYSVLKSFVSNNMKNSNVKIIQIENLKLNLQFGTEDVITTTGLVTISNILISFLLAKYVDNYRVEKYSYEIKPIYENKNKIDLFLETKIRIELFSLLKALKNYKKAKNKVYKKKKNIKRINHTPIKNIS